MDNFTVIGIGLIAAGFVGIILMNLVFSASKKRIKSRIYDNKE